MISGSGGADRDFAGADGGAPPDLAAAAGLAIALRNLLEASATLIADNGPPGPIEQQLTGHLRGGLSDLAYVAENFPGWERANLQRGVDAYLAAHSPEAEWFSISSADRDYEDLASVISRPGRPLQIAAVTHGTAATGPDEAMEIVQSGLVPSAAPDGSPVFIGVRSSERYGPECRIEILARVSNDHAPCQSVRPAGEGFTGPLAPMT